MMGEKLNEKKLIQKKCLHVYLFFHKNIIGGLFFFLNISLTVFIKKLPKLYLARNIRVHPEKSCEKSSYSLNL